MSYRSVFNHTLSLNTLNEERKESESVLVLCGDLFENLEGNEKKKQKERRERLNDLFFIAPFSICIKLQYLSLSSFLFLSLSSFLVFAKPKPY